MKRLLDFFSIATGAVALLSVIWIIVPAPAYHVWLFSVAASEWSLWFGALALIAVVCALLSRGFYGSGNVWVASLIIGAAAFLISLYPLLTTLAPARAHGVSLSLTQYFNGASKEVGAAETRTEDFTTHIYARPNGVDLKLDVYQPTPAGDVTGNGAAAVIVVHGGSWNAGERSDFPAWNRWLKGQGFTVFDIDYRLAPQPNYLAATADIKCAVRWVKARAAEFRISPDRLALVGRSAGGHLALLAAYSAGDGRLPASCSGDENAPDEKVRAVVSFYAPADLLWSYDNPANRLVIDGPATLSRFLGGSPHDSIDTRERFVLASPVSHVGTETTPTLLIHGGRDQLVRSENMWLLAQKLQAARVSHKTLFIPYAQHGFDYNSSGWAAQVAKPVVLDFLRENTAAK
jgi:acetyl esterase/lipase